MTLTEAKNLRQGDIIYSVAYKNADKTPRRYKVTSVKTWKRSPDRVEVGLKWGFYEYFKMNETELHHVSVTEPE